MATIVTNVNGNKVSIDTAEAIALRNAASQKGTTPLDGMTVAQADAWITANVTDLATNKTALRLIVKLLFWLAARITALENK